MPYQWHFAAFLCNAAKVSILIPMQVTSNVSYAKDRAKEKVQTTALRTQGMVSHAQERVADRVSKTLDKVQTGLDTFGLVKVQAGGGTQQFLSPTHEPPEQGGGGASAGAGGERPPTPKFLQHFEDFQDIKSIKSTTSASSDDLSIATTVAGCDKAKTCSNDMELMEQQVYYNLT